MKKSIWLLLAVAQFSGICLGQSPQRKILVFYKTTGYYHESIPDAAKAISKLGVENGFTVDTTRNAALFTEENLKKYASVVFLSTSGDMLDTIQQTDFERYIQAGGGYMGIHSASAGEYNWPWYGKMVGAVFNRHPEQQEGIVKVADNKNSSTSHLPAQWKIMDEWYNFKSIQPDIHVLLTVDESTYKGGTNGSFHPIAWYHEFEGGRSFYTAIGHRNEEYLDPLFLKHILAGIQYSMGNKIVLDYSKAKTKRLKN